MTAGTKRDRALSEHYDRVLDSWFDAEDLLDPEHTYRLTGKQGQWRVVRSKEPAKEFRSLYDALSFLVNGEA